MTSNGAHLPEDSARYVDGHRACDHGDNDFTGFDNVQRSHALGVKPSGNALTSNRNARDFMGLFGHLPDEVLQVVLDFLDQDTLTSLGRTSRGLYAYCTFDNLWRDIAISNMNEQFIWRGSWRSSLRRLPSSQLARVDCSHLFSDSLHRPYFCSQLSLKPYTANIPPQNQIPRLEDISPNLFNESWIDMPFILTQPVKEWQVYKAWDEQALLDKYENISFRCEAVDWKLKTYIQYMSSTQDESPLYLFDHSFVEKMGLQGAYEPPQAFQEDLFTLLGEERPDHRWLIVGPERSGSTFHIDPNATSAWNAVVRGSKYWIMMPRGTPPPGIYVSEDRSEVTSPLSIAEWLLSFHAEARRKHGCLEGICREGELLHVPSGW